MLQQVCDYVHNYFEDKRYSGSYEIIDGTLDLPFLEDGQRFQIKGSALNDGIYTYHSDGVYNDDGDERADLAAESFDGVIVAMNVPRAFVVLTHVIAAWVEKNKSVVESPYTSESFGGYSYSKASGGGSNGGYAFGWQNVYGASLNAYRKIS